MNKDPMKPGIYEDAALQSDTPANHLISPQELHDRSNAGTTFLVIDVRGPGEYKEGHVLSAVNIPLGRLTKKLASIPHDQLIVTYCNMHHRGESRGERAAALLRERGYQAWALDGGYPAWKQQGEHTVEVCYFCDKIKGRVPVIGGAIYEDDLVYASHNYNDEGPTYLGSLMVQTKRHAPSFAELTDAEAQAIGLLMARLSRALKACVGAERTYTVFFGEAVPHLHIYVTARYPGTPKEYWRMHVDEWPDAPGGNSAEVAALCERLRTYLVSAS